MLNKLVRNTVLALMIAAPIAQAESLGETVNHRIGPQGAAALADLPPDFLELMHASSSVMTAHSLGLVSDRSAAAAFVILAQKLDAVQQDLVTLEADAYQIALILQGRVFFSSVIDLVSSMEQGAELTLLLETMDDIVGTVAAGVEERLSTQGDAPNIDCFETYGRCMEFCANQGGVVQRSLCGMDCNLDLSVCLGKAIGNGLLDLLRAGGGPLRRIGGAVGR